MLIYRQGSLAINKQQPPKTLLEISLFFCGKAMVYWRWPGQMLTRPMLQY